jgi:CHAT domain-containing protein
LARSADEHVTQDELEFFLSSGASSTRESLGAGMDSGAISFHLAQCEKCRLLTVSHAAVEARLLSLRPVSLASRGTDCPANEEWLFLAAGLLPAEQVEKDMQHVRNCDHCGPLLRNAVEDFANDLTSDEKSVLNGLKSTDGEWQRGLAKRLSSVTQPRADDKKNALQRWKYFAFRPRLLFSTGIFLLIGSVVWWFARPQPQMAERLLALAYTQRREMEPRIPGARYSPLRVQRGSDRSRFDHPVALLEAEEIIGKKLAQHPKDPDWLQTKARAEVLDGNYEIAIQTLQQLVQSYPNRPSLLTDLATAYFQRAEAQDRAIDYGIALDLLGRALAKSPDDPVGLFNKALVDEKMFLYAQAREDWERYLKVDPNGDWAKEAERHLHAVKEKLENEKQSLRTPLVAPKNLLEYARSHNLGTHPAMQERAEDYLDKATTDWLPEAFSSTANATLTQPQSDETNALTHFAKILIQHHHDQWLADLLNSSRTLSFSQALSALSEAYKANLAGKPSSARQQAKVAATLFQLIGNEAGEVRADLETVYALHWSAQGKACLENATVLNQKLKRHRYSWIETQLSLEQFSCSNLVGDLKGASEALNRGLMSAQDAGYKRLYLRGLGFSAVLETVKGNRLAAWALDRKGLSIYWDGRYPPVRANQFYSDLCYNAEDLGQWYAAVTLARASLSAIAPDEDRSFEAMARYRLAKDQLMVGQQDEAEGNFSKANQLFEGLPSDEDTRLYRTDSEIGLAKIELQRNQMQECLARLESIRSGLSQIGSQFVALDFYQVWAEAQRRIGNSIEAARSFRSAIAIAELRLNSLQSERERLEWNKEAGAAYRNLIQIKLVDEKDSKGALELWEWYRSAALRTTQPAGRGPKRLDPSDTDFKRIATGPPLPDMYQVQDARRLLGDQTILAYAALPDGLAIWLYSDSDVTARWIPDPAKRLYAIAERFRSECADPSSDLVSLHQNARRLYDFLIAPIEGELARSGIHSLIVEPDGPVEEIPMEALRDTSARYLGESYTVSLSPGLLYNSNLRELRRFSDHLRALVVGSPALTADLPLTLNSLTDARFEARAVAAKFSGAELLVGKNATWTAVMRSIPRANIFHFAGHAVTSTAGTGLIFAGDEPSESPVERRADNFDAMRLHQCQLIVLSACATGPVGASRLVEPNNLVETFLRAGVPHVVASRWDVDSKVTATLMTDFYEKLLSGTSVSSALQSAALELRNHSQFGHPYYWAAFSAYGRI